MADGPKRRRRFTSDATENFFEERDPQNKHKTEIIEGFFKAYAAILLSGGAAEVDYVDLYAGRGYYDRCALEPTAKGPIDATPLRVLRAVVADFRFRLRVQTWFNDGLRKNVDDLNAAIARIPGIETLKYPPLVTCGEVNDKIAAQFRARKDVPTFFFLDPFGYVGLTRPLLSSALEKSWGCDVAFFFNYKRINMNLGTGIFDQHLVAMFGDSRLAELRASLKGVLGADEREDLVLNILRLALRDIGASYFLSYRFRYADGKTSHHLVFFSRHRKGYDTMKARMAAHSAHSPDGVPLFEFVPHAPKSAQPSLFETQVLTPPRHFPYSIGTLANDLYRRFRGRTLKISEIFESHNVDTPYVRRNYSDAVWNLANRNLAELRRSVTAKTPKRGQCPDDTGVTFL